MPRTPLITTIAVVLMTTHLGLGQTPNPHVDPTVVTGGCRSCHVGHGSSRSPMMDRPQREICMSCHGSSGNAENMRQRGLLASGARPTSIDEELNRAYVHPVSDTAFSRHDPAETTCSSCHSPHRSSGSNDPSDTPSGVRKSSTRNPNESEFELCESCHGSGGTTSQSLTDISRLLDPNNRSFHPVEAVATERSPSVIPGLSGKEINCTDCHNNNTPGRPKGPHGSDVQFLLAADYTVFDGNAESPTVYALCYRCHRRRVVLESSAFPEHDRHITEIQASCATCHSAHGSMSNRALIRFGEETVVAGVAPSLSTGRLAFESDGPGSGACYLTCHARDHAPETYGAMSSTLDPAWRPGAFQQPYHTSKD